MMEAELRLAAEQKEQLLMRVKQCLDNDVLDMNDWIKILDILLEACKRECIEVSEQMLTQSFKQGDSES